MNTVLYHNPGQQVTIVIETLNVSGIRTDSTALPVISRILFPTLAVAAGYPQNMTKLDTGLYYYKFQLPTGATAVGSYIVDVNYFDPALGHTRQNLVQIIVTTPYGNYNVTAT